MSQRQYADFTPVSNYFMENLREYNALSHLKFVALLFYIPIVSKDTVMRFCGFSNSTIFYNALNAALAYGHAIETKEGIVLVEDHFCSNKPNKYETYYDRLRDTFTAVPNKFFKVDLPIIETIGEMKVILYVFRKTFGFHKQRESFSFTHDEIIEKLKISSHSAVIGVEANLKVGRFMQLEKGVKNKPSLYVLSEPNAIDATIKKEKKTLKQQELFQKEIENDFDYEVDGVKYRYPKSRRGKNSWKAVKDGPKLTYHHVMDMWIEYCYVPIHGEQPFRRQDKIKLGSIIKSIQKRGYTPQEFRWTFLYCYNQVWPIELKKSGKEIQFYQLNNYIGLSKKLYVKDGVEKSK